MKIFLSYAKEDKEKVKEFHDYLKNLGLDPWMDTERLLPGLRWEHEIERALKEANVIIIFISPNSVNKRSFVTREANEAIQNLRYKKPEDIYIIPVVLEQCEVPEEIAKIAQYIEYSDPTAKEKIFASIVRAAEQQKIALLHGVEHGQFRVFKRTVAEKTPGQPGYEISIDYPEFLSDENTAIVRNINAIFAGRANSICVSNRTKPWELDLENHPMPEEGAELDLPHINGRWDSFHIAHVTDRLISIRYDCDWYGAGAAHTNQFIETFNYSLSNGKIFPYHLRDLFHDGVGAANIISKICRESLAREFWNRSGDDIQSDKHWNETFLEATAPSLENFQVFTAGDGKLTFYFKPYQIAAYVYGSWDVDISLYDLRNTLLRGNSSPINF
ncbi:TIR domain-containing protein [Delftia sp.]|uniref:TIR domain-containing protein n=1 Tax=Delftia sp. TaxID=1886637 RepID=UPI00259CDF80|nr:TIR domain-containing protein [Delftia sp.]